jgi:hypothetical protein
MRCTEPRFPASYEAVHRYDGAVIQRGRRDGLVPCVVQPRDVALVRDVRRYKFLTAPQLRELWWPESSVQAADRRLLKLFRAGYLDRFRPISRRGSFPWTYQLGVEGHRLLQRAGVVAPRHRFVRREVYDYGHVLHDLQLNAWVLAYRRAAGDVFLSWEGESRRARQGPARECYASGTIGPPKGCATGALARCAWTRSSRWRDTTATAAACSLSNTTEPDASTRTTRSSAATTPSSAGGGTRRRRAGPPLPRPSR